MCVYTHCESNNCHKGSEARGGSSRVRTEEFAVCSVGGLPWAHVKGAWVETGGGRRPSNDRHHHPQLQGLRKRRE